VLVPFFQTVIRYFQNFSQNVIVIITTKILDISQQKNLAQAYTRSKHPHQKVASPQNGNPNAYKT
jgi:hypothetical protein